MSQLVNFSMGDLQTLWENGGQDAYFAAYRGTAAQANPVNKTPLDSPIAPPDTPNAKAQTSVLVKGKKGNFFRNQMTNVGGIKGAGKGAMRTGQGALIRTANIAGKSVKAAGSGAATAGSYVSDRAHELGSAIRRNPRTAGAVILGSTALTAGGAYAMSRRDN